MEVLVSAAHWFAALPMWIRVVALIAIPAAGSFVSLAALVARAVQTISQSFWTPSNRAPYSRPPSNRSNQTALYTAINGLTPGGSTCIECGLDNAEAELTSVRARAGASKVIVLLTDGVSNVGNSVNGATLCRDNNITVYTIGYGSDVNDTELTNIALLTYGNYYFAPNVVTLNSIFQNIGR